MDDSDEQIEDIRYTAGVRIDCKKLLEKFIATSSLRYDEFSAIWREMNMSYIFYGRADYRELLEFTEAILNLTKNMWLNNNDDLHIQVGGFYLTYAFYMKQPLKSQSPIQIRMTQLDWMKCQSFVNFLLYNNHWDTYYIFCKLMAEKAFNYVFQKNVTYFGKSTDTVEDKKQNLSSQSKLETFLKSETFQLLQQRSEMYETQKREFLPFESCSTDPHLITSIKTFSSTTISQSKEDSANTSQVENEQERDIGRRRAELKNKQFVSMKKSR
ncbi:Small nuclear RNA activating complex, polypeptide 1, 43kDa [Chamberlinius hualienensis]